MHCSGSAFLLSETRLTLSCEVGGNASETPPVADEVRMAWRSGQFFVSVSEQEKLGTTRGSVTVNHDAVGLRGAGGAKKKSTCFGKCFFQ